MFAWLRNNVLGGVLTTLLIVALTGAYALPGRLSNVEQATVELGRRHDADVEQIERERGGIERELERLLEMHEATQRQNTAILQMQEIQVGQFRQAMEQRGDEDGPDDN